MSKVRSALMGLVLASTVFAVGCNAANDSSDDTGAPENAPAQQAQSTQSNANEGTTQYANYFRGNGYERGFKNGERREARRDFRRDHDVRRGHDVRRDREMRERGWWDRFHDWRRTHGFWF